MSRQHLCSSYVTTLFCIICISVTTQKVLSQQRLIATELDLLLQLCFLCCHLDFCVGDVLHVATPIYYVATTLFCKQHLFLLRPSFPGRDITFMPFILSLIPIATGLFCVHLISVLRPEDLYREIKTPFKLVVCHNIDSPCCN